MISLYPTVAARGEVTPVAEIWTNQTTVNALFTSRHNSPRPPLHIKQVCRSHPPKASLRRLALQHQVSRVRWCCLRWFCWWTPVVCRVSSLATVSFILAVISPLVIVSSSSAFFIARCLLTVCFSPSTFLRFFICFSLFLFLDTVAHFTRAVPCALNERKVGLPSPFS